ncbi:MAG: DUF115 domain-containing protein [Lachnospiraceae bacterium]|nr:DUF115 domain-containing protein [Lachnospiraceae bacterium]
MKVFNYLLKSLEAHYQNWESKHFEWTKYGIQMQRLKDIHNGERCFIIANGPSLRATDLELLYQKNEITFAMNRIYKLFSETNWRPTYYVCEDINIFHESLSEINAIPAKKKFIPVNHKWYHGINIDDALYFWANYNREKDFPDSFSTNIAKQMDSLGTVTFTCINIAAYMGFKEIYLLGVDHNYRVTINEQGETIVDNTAKDYFCDNYDTDIKDIVVHDMGQNTRAYRKAKKYCDEHDIHIYNSTRGGKLEVFPRIDFDSLFLI